ncbi:hypothetical protein A2382_03650 [Candidatus Woesebacteria bacterium RIFOXYB1_FULL_38_16]|uniref:Uncharacterized protein n=1 Tax=Candidatus Woesebacteria bacterium RIFOXYB1_FULL_38_16 TaxID=1802538 RepID=A0A1F8CRQ4_9BACT|nr:MAG: hypothetical protein A2191_02050 [Candidatus Woesebacteria bacterium RIFOXYA1_FULL_38_9]OGM78980.1 MAG: hypothetical protein A2382_03650 [Candidatus Woesebacteria bacterium RIFOXYB1_FULL_38_16]
MAINIELENLYYADKKERDELDETKKSLNVLLKHDQHRLSKLKELLPQIDADEIWNCHYLAYLFQHGETIKDYENAHQYAKKAIEMGSTVTKWLYAATLDRLLVSQGKLQMYGTQFKKINKKWELLPVDNQITDEERAKYGVPPLHEALSKFQSKYS